MFYSTPSFRVTVIGRLRRKYIGLLWRHACSITFMLEACHENTSKPLFNNSGTHTFAVLFPYPFSAPIIDLSTSSSSQVSMLMMLPRLDWFPALTNFKDFTLIYLFTIFLRKHISITLSI